MFQRGTELAAKQGLILVDTKYEFGMRNGVLTLIDEIHTPDSSRYFYAEGYERRQAAGEPQKQLSKEFVREWLMAHDFMGKEGQMPPHMDNDFLDTVTQRYVELYEKVTGMDFQGDDHPDPHTRVAEAVEARGSVKTRTDVGGRGKLSEPWRRCAEPCVCFAKAASFFTPRIRFGAWRVTPPTTKLSSASMR